MADERVGLTCPHCGKKTRVKETRAGNGCVRRRRVCECGYAETTKEISVGIPTIPAKTLNV